MILVLHATTGAPCHLVWIETHLAETNSVVLLQAVSSFGREAATGAQLPQALFVSLESFRMVNPDDLDLRHIIVTGRHRCLGAIMLAGCLRCLLRTIMLAGLLRCLLALIVLLRWTVMVAPFTDLVRVDVKLSQATGVDVVQALGTVEVLRAHGLLLGANIKVLGQPLLGLLVERREIHGTTLVDAADVGIDHVVTTLVRIAHDLIVAPVGDVVRGAVPLRACP